MTPVIEEIQVHLRSAEDAMTAFGIVELVACERSLAKALAALASVNRSELSEDEAELVSRQLVEQCRRVGALLQNASEFLEGWVALIAMKSAGYTAHGSPTELEGVIGISVKG